MLTLLLVSSALLYFILDRKVRLALIPGITIMVSVCCSYCWNLFRYNRFTTINSIHSPGYRYYLPIIVLLAAFTAVIAMLSVFTFLFLGRLISKHMFKVSGENGKNERLAKVLLLTASCITAVAGLYQLICAAVFSSANARYSGKIILMSRMIKRLGSSMLSVCIYGIIFLAVAILGIILALTNKSIFKSLSVPIKPSKHITLTAGLILSAIGNLGIWTIAAVGLVIWRRIFFFDGYNYTRVLCFICVAFIIAGMLVTLIGLAKIKGKVPVIRLVFSIVLIIGSVCNLIWMILALLESMFRIKT